MIKIRFWGYRSYVLGKINRFLEIFRSNRIGKTRAVRGKFLLACAKLLASRNNALRTFTFHLVPQRRVEPRRHNEHNEIDLFFSSCCRVQGYQVRRIDHSKATAHRFVGFTTLKSGWQCRQVFRRSPLHSYFFHSSPYHWSRVALVGGSLPV